MDGSSCHDHIHASLNEFKEVNELSLSNVLLFQIRAENSSASDISHIQDDFIDPQ